MANAALDAQVAALHAQSKRSYGRPRIVRGLRKQGLRVGHERVRRSLKRQSLGPVYKRPYRVTTDSNHRKPVAPSVLNRRFDGWQYRRSGSGRAPA
jgi:putative transposase